MDGNAHPKDSDKTPESMLGGHFIADWVELTSLACKP